MKKLAVTLISLAVLIGRADAQDVVRRAGVQDLKYKVGQFSRPSRLTVGGSVSLDGFTPINVLAFGVDNTGAESCADSLQAAIDSVSAWGGGDIYFPPGTYLNAAGASTTNSSVVFSGDVPRNLSGGGPRLLRGNRNPVNYVYAPIGSVYQRWGDADSTLFYKKSANDSTGWYCLDSNVALNSADIDTLEFSAVYNVMAYGAEGDGVADDSGAIQDAIDAAMANGGGEVYFPAGTYLCESALTVGDYVSLRGVGKVATTIKRGFTGDFITAFGGKSSIFNLTIDGDTVANGVGTGITITSLKPAQFFCNIEVINFVESCIEFPIDSGSQSHIIGCRLYTTGAVNTVAAVTVLGADTQATPRHYIGNEGSGCTLYDFGGCSDVFVTGGYTANLIFGAASNKVMIDNMRIGAAGDTVRVRGASHRITGSVSAIPFRVGGTGHDIDCEAPDWSFTDISTNSMITQRLVTFTPSWTGSSSNPSIGNGSITCSYSRSGSLITAFYSLSIGSTTSFGSGVWRFALPQMDNSSVVCAGGSGFTSDVPDSNLTFVTRTQPGAQYCTLWAINSSTAAAEQIQHSSLAWASPAVIRFYIQYFVR